MKRLRYAALAAVLLSLATLALFWPATRHAFINFDDPDYVTSNPHVLKGLSWEGLAWALRSQEAHNWHPLTWWSHMLDVEVFGLNPRGHHLVNVLWHALNAGLLFWMLHQWTRAFWRSLLVAVLFAWHPAHVESVAWIAERKDVLSTFFGLLMLLTFSAYAQKPFRLGGPGSLSADKQTPSPWPSPQRRVRGKFDSSSQADASMLLTVQGSAAGMAYILALIFFALGLMAKPMLVTVPFLLLLLDFWPLNRMRATTGRSHPLAGLLLEKAPFFLLSLGSCVVTLIVQKESGALQNLARFSGVERMGNALISYFRYLGKLLWPDQLAVFYPHPGAWPPWQVAAVGAALAALCLAAWLSRRRFPYVFTGWFWFLGTLLPVIGLVQVGKQAMADRYTYLPFVGLFILLAWGAYELRTRWRQSRILIPVLLAVACVACAMQTRRQLSYWVDSKTLFAHALTVTKNNAQAHFSLGLALDETGQFAQAIECYQEALQIAPSMLVARNNLGIDLVRLGRAEEAVELYTGALQANPGSAELHNNFGLTLARLGRWDEAIEQYAEAIRLRPSHPEARNNLGHALSVNGRQQEAIAHLTEAIRLEPNLAEAHYNLANALNFSDRLEQAIAEYHRAIELKPGLIESYEPLANGLVESGKMDQALQIYRQAVAQRPDKSELHYGLARVLGATGKMDEAINEYRTALRLQPQFAKARFELGDLLARSGRFSEATEQYSAGLQVDPENAEGHVCLAVCLIKQSRPDEARAHLLDALRLKPDHPQANQLIQALSPTR